MCGLKMRLWAKRSMALQRRRFSLSHQQYLTSPLTLAKCVLCSFLWELLHSKVPSNVCQQDSNWFMLMIVTVQRNGHIYPEHVRNSFVVSFALEVSAAFVLCEFLLNEVLEATERQGLAYFLCQGLWKKDFPQLLTFLAWNCARCKWKWCSLNDKFVVL